MRVNLVKLAAALAAALRAYEDVRAIAEQAADALAAKGDGELRAALDKIEAENDVARTRRKAKLEAAAQKRAAAKAQRQMNSGA